MLVGVCAGTIFIDLSFKNCLGKPCKVAVLYPAPPTNMYMIGAGHETSEVICDRIILRKGGTSRKTRFLSLFNLPPFQGSGSPRLQIWFVSSLGLLLHRSKVKSLSKAPVLSGEPPKWGVFGMRSTRVLAPPIPEVGGARNLQHSLHEGVTFSIHFLIHAGSTLFTLVAMSWWRVPRASALHERQTYMYVHSW